MWMPSLKEALSPPYACSIPCRIDPPQSCFLALLFPPILPSEPYLTLTFSLPSSFPPRPQNLTQHMSLTKHDASRNGVLAQTSSQPFSPPSTCVALSKACPAISTHTLTFAM
eukprot:353206-Chlamydomonas_euryale.AAC.5